MKTIGFIGIGVMGASMAKNLMKNGYALRVFTRTKQKAQGVIDAGALWCDTVAACVDGCDAVITMVGYPLDVEQVYFGPQGIIENAAAGALLIDMTTTSPQLAVRIDAEAKKRGLKALDAPVSGGDVGAQKGTLTIMVGGDKDAFAAAMPLFSCMGTSITYTGKAGNGQHTKMANQIAIAGIVSGVCEAIAYAKAVGLDPQNMLDCIGGGAAGSWQLANTAPRMLRGDFAPGFFVKHFLKDMTIALEEAEEAGVDLAVVKTVRAMYEDLAASGHADEGTQALLKHYIKEEQL